MEVKRRRVAARIAQLDVSQSAVRERMAEICRNVYGGRDYVMAELERHTQYNDLCVYVGAFVDDLLAGFVCVRTDVNFDEDDARRKGFVEALRVHVEYRNRGLARELLRHLEHALFETLRLDVLQYTTFTANFEALNLSQSMGYVKKLEWAYFTIDDPVLYTEPPFLPALKGVSIQSYFARFLEDADCSGLRETSNVEEIVDRAARSELAVTLLNDEKAPTQFFNQWWALSEIHEASVIEILKSEKAFVTNKVLSIGRGSAKNSPIGDSATIFSLYPSRDASVSDVLEHVKFWALKAVDLKTKAFHFFYPSKIHCESIAGDDPVRCMILLELEKH